MTTAPLGRILVVDDSEDVLRAAEDALHRAGYTVLCLDHGHAAAEAALGFRPDLVLVDSAMPGFSGFDVCRAFGVHPSLRGVPIVVMSELGEAIEERFERTMGIVDHVTKPLAAEVLTEVVTYTLAKTRDHEPARRDTDPRAVEDDVARRLAAVLSQLSATEPEMLAAEVRAALMEPSFAPRLWRAARALPGVPALAGNLKHVPLAELLQMLSLQRQSGVLTVTRDPAEISISLKKGEVRLVTGEGIPDELLLGNILVQEKKLTARDLEVLLSNRRGTRRLLGGQLVTLGYMSREDLHSALRRQSAELVYELLRWGRGHFELHRMHELPPEVLEFEFGLTTDELLLEGFRRVDEWGLIEGALPSFDLVPLRAPGGLETLVPHGLNAEELTVLAAVDGRRTIEEIINHVGTGTFQVARVLYRLVSTRLVSVPPPA